MSQQGEVDRFAIESDYYSIKEAIDFNVSNIIDSVQLVYTQADKERQSVLAYESLIPPFAKGWIEKEREEKLRRKINWVREMRRETLQRLRDGADALKNLVGAEKNMVDCLLDIRWSAELDGRVPVEPASQIDERVIG